MFEVVGCEIYLLFFDEQREGVTMKIMFLYVLIVFFTLLIPVNGHSVKFVDEEEITSTKADEKEVSEQSTEQESKQANNIDDNKTEISTKPSQATQSSPNRDSTMDAPSHDEWSIKHIWGNIKIKSSMWNIAISIGVLFSSFCLIILGNPTGVGIAAILLIYTIFYSDIRELAWMVILVPIFIYITGFLIHIIVLNYRKICNKCRYYPMKSEVSSTYYEAIYHTRKDGMKDLRYTSAKEYIQHGVSGIRSFHCPRCGYSK